MQASTAATRTTPPPLMENRSERNEAVQPARALPSNGPVIERNELPEEEKAQVAVTAEGREVDEHGST